MLPCGMARDAIFLKFLTPNLKKVSEVHLRLFLNGFRNIQIFHPLKPKVIPWKKQFIFLFQST